LHLLYHFLERQFALAIPLVELSEHRVACDSPHVNKQLSQVVKFLSISTRARAMRRDAHAFATRFGVLSRHQVTVSVYEFTDGLSRCDVSEISSVDYDGFA